MVVSSGCLETLRTLRDGEQTVTAFHLPGDTIHLAVGRRGGIRHRAVVSASVCYVNLSGELPQNVARVVFESALARIEADERHIMGTVT